MVNEFTQVFILEDMYIKNISKGDFLKKTL